MHATALHRRTRATSLAVGGLVVGITIATGVAQAASSDTNTIYGCVSNKDGAVRVVAQGVACGKNESAITWNQTGPAGAPGAPGPAGRDGRDGQAGPASPAASEPHSTVVGTVTTTDSYGAAINFDITGYATSTTNSGTTTAGGGGGAGKATLQAVTITKTVDANSPTLFSWITRGVHIPRLVIHLNGDPGETVTLDEVLVTNLTTENTGSSTDKLHEQVSLTAAKTSLSVGSNTWTWDSAQNTGSNG